jgi:hypothetical protein
MTKKLVAGEEIRAIVGRQHGIHASRAAEEIKPALRLVVPDRRIGAAVPHLFTL